MNKGNKKADPRKYSFDRYTVMIDGVPVVVKAQSQEAAIAKAKKKVESERKPEQKEVGDVS